MRWSSILVAAIPLALWAAEGARANVIYNNGGPDQVTFYAADSSNNFSKAGETFVLGAGANTIDGVNWWGACTTGGRQPATCPTGDFTIYIYDNSLSLVTSFAVGNANQTATGNVIAGAFPENSYSASIPNLTLTAGANYVLGISNSTTTDFIWGWETTSTFQDGFHLEYSGGGWGIGYPDDLAFNLTGPEVSAVPEPNSAILLLAGLVGLMGLGALRFRQSASN